MCSSDLQPAPRPATITWVCPPEFTDVEGVCRQVTPYTFTEVTEYRDYTYTTETRVVPCYGDGCPGSQFRDFGTDWSGTTCPNGGTMHDGRCIGWTGGSQQVTVQVKATPPDGWSDNGTNYERTVETRNELPSGWTDDGTQWIRTAAKIAVS